MGNNDILVVSISFLLKDKAMKVNAWCLIACHVHLVFRSAVEFRLKNY